MTIKRIRFIKDSSIPVVPDGFVKNYYELPFTQFIEMIMPPTKTDVSFCLVPEDEPADYCFYSVQHTDDSVLRPMEINIFLSVENLEFWGSRRGHYQYFNKFGRFGSKKTDIFIHNDINTTIVSPGFVAYPLVWFRIRYFRSIQSRFDDITITPFQKKRFALFVSKNLLNPNKKLVWEELSKIGPVDHISIYDPIVKDKSCYNSRELVSLFNRYKFIICFENSHTEGYITEKIFNVFLSKSIPIYDGAPNIGEYVESGSFIPFNRMTPAIVKYLNENENAYNAMILREKLTSKSLSLPPIEPFTKHSAHD
jgi:hypothetical protein